MDDMHHKTDPQNKKTKHRPSPQTAGASPANPADETCWSNSDTETDHVSDAVPEESEGRHDNYGEQIYLRMTTREKILTKEQLEDLIGHLREHYPHHARLIFFMRHIGLWLSLGLGLQIGDFAVPGIVRISRGWSERGEFPVPGYERGQFQQGILSPEILPVSAAVDAVRFEQIAHLKEKGFPTGPNDWLFPGRNTNHPWGPGAFRYVVLRPALRQLQLPDVSAKELYFSMMRVLIQELAARQTHTAPSQPKILCPTCGQDVAKPSPCGLAHP